MSYILDALKKADQERTLGEVPDLEVAHWGERRAERSYRWVWGIIALLVINGVLLAVLLGRDPAGEAEPVSTQPDTAVPLQVEPQARARIRALENPRLPVMPPAELPVSTPQAAVQPAVPESRPPVTMAAPASVAAPVPSRAGDSDVLLWEDLPLEFRSRFVLPHLDVHVYADDPQRRFIMVNLQKYREGDTLENGARLEEIQPASIQLYFEGTRFRMEK